MKYKVLIACRSDATGRAYKPGQTIKDGDFPADVIANWLEIGVLAVPPKPVQLPRKKADNGRRQE